MEQLSVISQIKLLQFQLRERKYQHPVLKKVIKSKKKYNVHDENNKYKNGDKVSIIETKPISKLKKWIVLNNSGDNAA